MQDVGAEGPPVQGTLPRWDFSTGPGLRSHQLATLRNMPSGDLPESIAFQAAIDPVCESFNRVRVKLGQREADRQG